jgi:hypothetical protein
MMRRGFSNCSCAVLVGAALLCPCGVCPPSAAIHMPLRNSLYAAADRVLAGPAALGAMCCPSRAVHSSASLDAPTSEAPPRVHLQDAPYEDLVTINWSEICAVPGQDGDNGRFDIDVDRVVLFDSPARLRVRCAVWRHMAKLVRRPTDKIVITGVGGNGKSHNVMLLVKELRDEGHVVVYVHDIERLLDDPWDVLLRELLFGLCRADLAAEVIDHAWTFIHKHFVTAASPELGGPWVLGKTALGMKGGSATLIDLKELMATLRVQILKHDKDENRRIIFVGDQDNKLHRALETRLDDDVRTVDQMIHRLPFDMKVLSASANNEGWVRRGWRNVIEQDIDEVPDKFAKRLFPNASGDGALVEEVKSKYNGYPLFWGLAEKAFLHNPNRACAELSDLCAIFLKEKRVSAERMVDRLKPCQKDEFLFMLYHQGVTAADPPEFYDRNLFQVCKEEAQRYSLKPICNAAVMRLWDAFSLSAINLSLMKGSFQYEVLFLYMLYARSVRHNTLNTLTPSGATNLDAVSIKAAKVKTGTSLFAHVFAAPPRCPSYDVVALRETNDVLEAVFFQCTLNNTHSDSFRRFMEHKVGGRRTQLERSVDALVASYPGFSGTVDVKFVWVLGGASIELEDWNQMGAKRSSRTVDLSGGSDMNQFRPTDGVLGALSEALDNPAFFVVSELFLLEGPMSVKGPWQWKNGNRFCVMVEECAVEISMDKLQRGLVTPVQVVELAHQLPPSKLAASPGLTEARQRQ